MSRKSKARVHFFCQNSTNSRALADRRGRTARLWSMSRAILARTISENSYVPFKNWLVGPARPVKEKANLLSFVTYRSLALEDDRDTHLLCNWPTNSWRPISAITHKKNRNRTNTSRNSLSEFNSVFTMVRNPKKKKSGWKISLFVYVSQQLACTIISWDGKMVPARVCLWFVYCLCVCLFVEVFSVCVCLAYQRTEQIKKGGTYWEVGS